MNYLTSKLGKDKFEAYDYEKILKAKEEIRMEYEADEIAKAMIGDYTEIKSLTREQEAALRAFAILDMLGTLLTSKDQLLKQFKNEKLIVDITVLYLYSNWRVWATYKRNKEVAKRYQELNNEIDKIILDDKIFDEEQISYFIGETD